jgi:hypothetical protein
VNKPNFLAVPETYPPPPPPVKLSLRNFYLFHSTNISLYTVFAEFYNLCICPQYIQYIYIILF